MLPFGLYVLVMRKYYEEESNTTQRYRIQHCTTVLRGVRDDQQPIWQA